MSNLPTTQPTTDLTEAQIARVQEFIEKGTPGIGTVTDAKLYRMLELYLGGNTFSQIAHMLDLKQIYVLYFAHTTNWYETKRNYLNEIQESLRNRIIDSKLRSQNFILLFVQSYQKKLERRLTKYLTTDDESHLAGIDFKELNHLMRAMEMLENTDNDGNNKSTGKTSPIGLNIGNVGIEVEKIGENKISITPKDGNEASVSSLLKKLANERRQKEKIVDKSLEKGDNNNETGVKDEK